MAALPTIRSGAVALYPLARRARIKTRVVSFIDDTEQRWRVAPTLASFVLTYTAINAADLATLRTFWLITKGRFDKTWSFTINGTTYNYLGFDSDEFKVVESKPERFDVRLSCRQWRAG